MPKAGQILNAESKAQIILMTTISLQKQTILIMCILSELFQSCFY